MAALLFLFKKFMLEMIRPFDSLPLLLYIEPYKTEQQARISNADQIQTSRSNKVS